MTALFEDSAIGLSEQLDATDLLILRREAIEPGPHHVDVGLPLAEYQERVLRMLYDADANAYAGAALARLRAELLVHPDELV